MLEEDIYALAMDLTGDEDFASSFAEDHAEDDTA